MVARAVVTLGVSTERGAVHAVALAESGEKLPERVLFHLVEKTPGDSKAELAAAVETAMDELAARIGPDREIGGAAVAYRDAAERRAIVTRLATGRWHTASLVSAKSAHLHVAGVMTWLDEFDDLLICEVVPGYQAFTLIDRGRRRVLAAIGQAGGATAEAMGSAVTAAWDQFEAAAVRPDAVVLIGSAAEEPEVLAAVDRFGAPVIPCKIADFAPAVGAALAALAELEEPGGELVERVHRGRGAAALFAAASVLAGGLVVGGVYVAGSSSRSIPGVVADARTTSDAHSVGGEPVATGPGPVEVPLPRRHEVGHPTGVASAVVPDPEPAMVTLDSDIQQPTQHIVQHWGSPAQDRPVPLVQAEPAMHGTDPATHESDHAVTPAVSGSGVPSLTTKVGAPDASLLFPGESPPPAAFTAESAAWWDNHFRTMVMWAAQQISPSSPVSPV
ncbi:MULTISPECIES: hypothetical protein [unclassified Nocardia]|uniref:hypothetical protein n=1 Tax=unclassified Nocardia TaxID=2637762 RepID=UPI001CE3E735|nr:MULTISPECIES: hypothetical protein [unclassified Nocardia]